MWHVGEGLARGVPAWFCGSRPHGRDSSRQPLQRPCVTRSLALLSTHHLLCVHTCVLPGGLGLQGVVSTTEGKVVRAFHRFTLVDQTGGRADGLRAGCAGRRSGGAGRGGAGQGLVGLAADDWPWRYWWRQGGVHGATQPHIHIAVAVAAVVAGTACHRPRP